MKKFIQISALLSLLVLFNVAATFAQSSFGTDVKIPFAFNVGDQSYEPGNYIVKFERFATGSAILSIHNTESNKTQTVLMNSRGEAASDEIKLVFDTLEGQRYLTKIRTPLRTYAVVMKKQQGEKVAQLRGAN